MRTPPLIFRIAAVLIFSACAPAPQSWEAGSFVDPHAVTLDGTLVSNLEKQFTNSALEECDRVQKQGRWELAAALDQRDQEIQAYLRAPTPQPSPGPSASPTLPAHPETSAEWKEFRSAWQELIAYHRRIRDLPIGPQWAYLNSAVRSILWTDQHRFDGVNYSIGHDAGPFLEEALKSVDRCLSRAHCSKPVFPPATREFLESMPIYSALMAKPNGTANLRARIAADFHKFQFFSNPTLERRGFRQLILPLDSGSFEDRGAELLEMQQAIESTWSSERMHLSVRWEKAPRLPELYRLLLGDSGGQRSFVDRTAHVIQLFPGMSARTVPHEIGHVLGFEDRYYTIWKPSDCAYVTQFRENDLMSTLSSNTVPAEDWKTLRRRYPVAPASAFGYH
jgi:hypothetical protein